MILETFERYKFIGKITVSKFIENYNVAKYLNPDVVYFTEGKDKIPAMVIKNLDYIRSMNKNCILMLWTFVSSDVRITK